MRSRAIRVSSSRWRLVALSALLLLLAGCDDGGGSGSTIASGPSTPTPVNNTQAIQVNPGPANEDIDVAFTSVTICAPGTATCQTIPNIEIDTGSIGLRLIASQVTISLPQVSDGTGNRLGNCTVFADNSYLWGPLSMADVHMAGEKASGVPIQLLGDASFASVPNSCNSGGTDDDSIAVLGANGILGIGLFRQDCGPSCVTSTSPNLYFSCPGANCTGTTVPLASQLQNPVWMFPQDNNVFLMTLPAIGATGQASVSGSLIFGIGTQSNNALNGAQVYTADNTGAFSVTFNGTVYSGSFIDSGSNGIFFLDGQTLGISECTDNPGFYCPNATQSYSVITTGTNGAAGTVAFNVANADTLFATGNSAFNNLGGSNGQSFDLGLPFFFGRNVFIGIEGQTTPGGTGPYWAY